MNHSRVFLLVLTIVLFCCIAESLGDLSPGQIHTNPHVLLISSYSPDFPTVFHQIDGVKSVLSPENVDLDIEFMDAKRFPSPEDINEFSQRLTKKIRRLPAYDLILVADDMALNFALEKQHELFNNTPIVFFGINEQSRADLPEKNPFITGMMEEVSVKETIDLMIQLQPDARTIIALSDDTISGKADAEKFLGYISSYPGYNLTVLSLANLTWNEYALKLQAINQSSSVLLLSASKDKNQVTTDFDESLQFIKQNLHVPLFHLWYYGMGDGIIGGALISQYDQGRDAALMADRILQGTPPSEIPVLKENSNPV
ncbi:MAG TPA: ABC transporter substrate binding protein, partial [Methanospirillum sp.]|uniref:ABC transporter substrate-binding protein n=1 Tax=Methanospirillum sp. TaxID=45200 RepID=UPI002CCE6D8F